MYKKTASADQFFSREAMHSTKGSRRGYDLLDQGESVLAVLSPEETRDSLVAHWKSLHVRVLGLPKGDPLRSDLGKQMHSIQERIRAIRPKTKAPGAGQHFIDVVRESVSKAQFDAWMAEAARRAAGKQLRQFPGWDHRK